MLEFQKEEREHMEVNLALDHAGEMTRIKSMMVPTQEINSNSIHRNLTNKELGSNHSLQLKRNQSNATQPDLNSYQRRTSKDVLPITNSINNPGGMQRNRSIAPPDMMSHNPGGMQRNRSIAPQDMKSPGNMQRNRSMAPTDLGNPGNMLRNRSIAPNGGISGGLRESIMTGYANATVLAGTLMKKGSIAITNRLLHPTDEIKDSLTINLLSIVPEPMISPLGHSIKVNDSDGSKSLFIDESLSSISNKLIQQDSIVTASTIVSS